jgi:hypothetical protein
MLVMIVVVPSTVLIMKSSLSLFDKKVREDVPNNVPIKAPSHVPNSSPNHAPATKVNYQHTPVHLAQ